MLSTLEDNVRVLPQDLAKPSLQAITEVIEKLYIDKVISDLGLAVTIYDILHVEGGFIYPSDGAAHFTVKFRLIIFRPFVDEVLTGRLIKSSRCAGLPAASNGRHGHLRPAKDGPGVIGITYLSAGKVCSLAWTSLRTLAFPNTACRTRHFLTTLRSSGSGSLMAMTCSWTWRKLCASE